MKKILLISYHFPPSTAVGGLRLAHFAKYLPHFGWDAYVLTIEDRYLKRRDDDRRKDLGPITIYKTRLAPTVNDAYLKLKSLYYSVLNRRRVSVEELTSSFARPCFTYSEPQETVRPYSSETVSQKIKRYVVSFLSMPDAERNWIIPAVLRAVREIKRENIDCILTSSPPHSVHLIGYLVKSMTGVRWVADFRDPWMTTGPKRLYSTCALSKKIEQWMEKKVLHGADMVVTTTEMLCDAFKKSNDRSSTDKFWCLTNGFDMEYFARFDHLQKYDLFTLTYAGGLYYGRTPEPIFKAVKALVAEGRLDVHRIKIKLIGECAFVNGQPMSRLVSSYGLDPVVEVSGPVPYAEAIRIIAQSHVALLFAPDQPFQIPAKVFDYMGAKTAILALSKEGATADLIRSTNTGAVFAPSNEVGIKEYIYQASKNENASKRYGSSSAVDNYDRKKIIQELAQQLHRIAAA